MTKSEKLKDGLQRVLTGDAWYGPPVYTIIGQAGFEVAYEKPGDFVSHSF